VLVVLAWPWCREIVAADRLVRGAIPATPRPAVRATVRRRPAAAVGPWVWRGDDFSGWLPAMVVRELRQGLQSGVFAWTFIGIQAAMFAAAAWTLLALGPDRPWWFLIGAAAIAGVIPLRGLTAVSGERAGNNLDLVRLTRLSATRIVLGKWLAIVAQGLLVAAALLPYIVLRYFFGRVNVFVELEMLGWLVAWSMVVAAATLALSTLPLWLRCGGLAAVAFCCVPAFKTANWLGGRAHMGQLGVADRFLILAGLGLYTVALLEYAAARIAPPTENHAGRTRLLAVAIAVAWGGIALCAESPWDGMETIRFTLPLLLCYAIGALLEKPVASGGPYVPFGRFGVAGKAAAAVFTPGWATAAPFVALTAAVCVAGMMVLAWRWPVSGQNACRAFLNLGCLAVATLVFPLPILVWLPRARLRPLLYALVQGACFLVFVYLTTVAPRDYTQAAHWSGWLLALPFPLAALAAYVRLDGDLAEAFGPAFLVAALLVTAVVLALVARPWLREMREVMRRVAGRDGT
jgi:hypothetical protein